MDDGEVIVLIFSGIAAAVGSAATATGGLHPLYLRANPAPGLVRLAVIAAMAWIAYVLLNHADPSVTGVYVFFYLVVGYAAIKVCGQTLAHGLGFRSRTDAGERRNLPAALVIGAFIVSTGLIFGGSLWGEADAVGDDEGGWWIPLTFFLLGWGTLLIAYLLFQRGERARIAERIRRERRLADARAAGAFLLSSAVVLTDAVAGDFWGWRHGIFSFGLIAVLLLVHEVFAGWARDERATPQAAGVDPQRVLESAFYLALGFAAWTASRWVDFLWGGA
jgi:hypothetical protein